MELVNYTPAAARVDVTTDTRGGSDLRIGMLVAKLTFTFDGLLGSTRIDDQSPFPLFATEHATELGLLPSDAVPRSDEAFEVILLGAAQSPGGKPATEVIVQLGVGDVMREMRVTGDRAWTRERHPRITTPLPFHRMALTYDCAFGGACTALLDAYTSIDLRDPINYHGKGFDAAAQAERLGRDLGAPTGYPVLDYLRRLPNLENPGHTVQRWEDQPEPYCWATVPQDIGFSQIRLIRYMRSMLAAGRDPAGDDRALSMSEHAFHRAHPDWIIALPPSRATVSMLGLSPGGLLRFTIPQVRVLADYVLGEKIRTRELAPHLMVLLPEQSRLYIVYRATFTLRTSPELERSFRLRLDEGWFQYHSLEV